MSKKETKRQNAKRSHKGLQKARPKQAQAEESLKEFVRFERLISDLSARFVNTPLDRVDSEINHALKQLLEFFQVDRCALLQILPGKTSWLITHVAAQEGMPPVPQGVELPVSINPWAYDKLIRKHEALSVSRLDDLPAEANVDRQTWMKWGIRSNLNIPIITGDPIDHIIVINSVKSERVWSEELIPRLQRLGEIFVNALERQRIETMLQTSEERFRQFFKNIPEYCYIISAGGDILHVNEAALETLGYKREELVGQPIARIYAPESLAKMEDLFPQWKKSGQIRNEEMVILTRTGERRIVILNTGTVKDKDGTILHSTSVQTDITDHKRAEIEASNNRRQLLRMERLSRMGELAASLAHELNQPLTSILINAGAALRLLQSGKLEDGELRDILQDIINDDKRAGGIIASLRSMVKLEEGERELVSINDLVREIDSLFRSEAVVQNIEVSLEMADVSSLIAIHKIHIQQVLINLLVNAAHSMALNEPNQRKIVLKTCTSDHGAVQVSVSDLGYGITKEALDHIFEPFFTTKRSGLGLGLSLSRSIIEAHGGRIWVENNPDKGVTFYFELPILTASNQ